MIKIAIILTDRLHDLLTYYINEYSQGRQNRVSISMITDDVLDDDTEILSVEGSVVTKWEIRSVRGIRRRQRASSQRDRGWLRREVNSSIVYAAYLYRRSIHPLNRRTRLMEFAVQGNNFLGRRIPSTIDAICHRSRFINTAGSWIR